MKLSRDGILDGWQHVDACQGAADRPRESAALLGYWPQILESIADD